MVGVRELRAHAEAILGVPARLHDYQWEGVAFLYRNRSALLADEMGLGKTVQTCVALSLVLSTKANAKRALIVSPAGLTVNWMMELERWVPSVTARRLEGDVRDREAFYLLPIPVLVGSYEQIRRDGLDRIPANTFDIVVLDEAQRIKNPHSATALACRLLSRNISWALTATPLENEREDVWSILTFLDSSIARHGTRSGLRQRLRSMMLRRRKREVRGELPPVIIQDVRIDLTTEQRDRYDEVWATRSEVMGRSRAEIGAVLLAVITKLKLVCNLDAISGASAKLTALRSVCQNAGMGSRVLVFSQFVETLEWLAPRLDCRCELVTGSMSVSARETVMERFRMGRTPRVLGVSLRAGGVGLNLGEATHVVMFDRWWNPAVESQAMYRAHRFERDTPLHVLRFLTVDTIEERIAVILEEKESMFREVIDSGAARARGFSVRELMRILEVSKADVPALERGSG